MAVNPVKIIQLFFMVLCGKSIDSSTSSYWSLIVKRFRLLNLKSNYQFQNVDPPEELLADSELLKDEIQAHFEQIQIILNSIAAEFMADINSSVASNKSLTDPVCPPTMRPFLKGQKIKSYVDFSVIL